MCRRGADDRSRSAHICQVPTAQADRTTARLSAVFHKIPLMTVWGRAIGRRAADWRGTTAQSPPQAWLVNSPRPTIVFPAD